MCWVQIRMDQPDGDRGKARLGDLFNNGHNIFPRQSNRDSVRISITSRKPSVVISAVFAPRRSISALVASVVPWMIWPMPAGAMPAFVQT